MATMFTVTKKRSCSSLLHDEELEEEEEEEDLDEDQLRRGPWTHEEDNLLIQYIACHGEGRWNLLAKCSGLKRTGKSCRLRWLNYLKPDVKRGHLTIEEQILIIQLHSKLGNRWSRIAKHLPGRTDNEIKNFWRTRMQKQAQKRLKIDIVNSATFHDAIGSFSIPRVIQNMEELAQSPPVPAPLPLTPPLPPPPPPITTTTTEDSLIRVFEGIQNFSSHHQVLVNNDSRLSPISISSTSSISSSPDSIMNNISTITEMSGHPTSPDQAFAGNTTTTTTSSNVDNYSFLKAPSCYYYVMNSSSTVYDTEAFINLGSSPTLAPSGLLANSISGSHMAENNWVLDDEVAEYGIWK